MENSLNVGLGQLFTCEEVPVGVCLHACYLTGALSEYLSLTVMFPRSLFGSFCNVLHIRLISFRDGGTLRTS